MSTDDDNNSAETPPSVTSSSPSVTSPESLHSELSDQQRAIIADGKTGIYSLQAIANRHGIKHKNTIARLLKKHNINPENNAKVRAKSVAIQRAEQAQAIERDLTHAQFSQAEHDDMAVAVAARMQADVTLVHRKDIKGVRTLIARLVGQLDAAMNSDLAMSKIKALLQTAGESETQIERHMRTVKEAMSMRGRSEILRNISMAYKNMIPLERTAFGLDNTDGSKAERVPIEERVKKWTAKEIPLPANVTALRPLKTA